MYRSDQETLYTDFYEKCLQESSYYDRAAGYFTSHSLKLMAKGLEYFLHNEGYIRMIANPYLNKEDIEKIALGYQAKYKVIEKSLLKQIELTAKNIEDDTLNVLAWLIYEGKLDIKIAFTENHALYHEKFGLFRDSEGHEVLFAGSANETLSGLLDNFERIDVFWQRHDQPRIQESKQDFEKLWNNQTNGLVVKEIDSHIKQHILSYRDVGNRPTIKKVERHKPQPREYQLKAIDALIQNNWSGILEMATGTGKTITSLLAMHKYYSQRGRVFCIIIAPFKHLVDQWRQECSKFDFNSVLLCYESTKLWEDSLNRAVRNFNLTISDRAVIITTYDTAKNPQFYKAIEKIQSNSFLIADECHYMGAPGFRHLPYTNISARIGLSATPDRWWDETGTQFIKDYFKDVVYQYTLEQAIAANKLTPYYYFPQVVNLTDHEVESYKKLTHKIIQQFHRPDKDEEMLSVLNRRRARILSKAEQKIPHLLRLLTEKGVENISHTIVYCAEEQVVLLTRLLSDLDLRVHKFDSTVPNKRRTGILQLFAAGEIQVLIAIKCLDEGVDIPSTKTAYFLASTSNPREFVQRRGRILRKYHGKVFAEIYDFITFPENADDNTFVSIAEKELPRFAEFANSSISPSQAKNTIMPYVSPYNLNYLMDMKPWDVYQKMKEDYEIK